MDATGFVGLQGDLTLEGFLIMGVFLLFRYWVILFFCLFMLNCVPLSRNSGGCRGSSES